MTAAEKKPPRLVVLAPDSPFPPVTGGRADVWRRLLALKRLGCEVMLVCWCGPQVTPPDEAQLRALRSAVEAVTVLRTRRGLREALHRLALLPSAPSHAASRRLSRPERERLLQAARNFAPDAIWVEGPYPGLAARALADGLHLPCFYRSHNIEHLYMAGQAAAAAGLRDKLAWRLACVGLERFELAMILHSLGVYDISSDDLRYWQSRGLRRGRWLAPLADLTPPGPADAAGPLFDVGFFGNLTTPNNVRGVQWLLEAIAPSVLRRLPETRFLIAGSNPAPEVESLCARSGHITLLANPADAAAVYRSARVLVNPVRTGSGVHMKSLDMLMTDAPLVSTSQGTRGLPPEVARLFRVHDDAAGFSAAIIEALGESDRQGAENTRASAERARTSAERARTSADRASARLHFSDAAIQDLIADLQMKLREQCS